jgi:acetyl-CoA carboxylase biotin carboxyl carrier protein
MNIKEIREIVGMMNENEITEFVIEREGIKLAIRKGPRPGAPSAVVQTAIPAAPASPPAAPPAKEEPEGVYIMSPMVGTFYSAASPDSPPFVEVGAEVDEETVVCIIEAMKVMNEIKAERKGRILEVLAENGEAVEFGKRLFRIG